MPITTRLLVGSLRDRFGARRRRHLAWGAMPNPAGAGAGWWAADPQWFPQGTPPRRNTQIEILIDGEETFRAAWRAIQQARHAVWLADWAMNVDMPLVRGADTATIAPAEGPRSTGYTVFDLLTAAAEHIDVRVLLWSGSLLFRPHALAARRGLKQMRSANPRIQGRPDSHIKLTHCHHQKTIVVDGRIAFVGGLDMTDFDTDRWDTTDHPVRAGLNWHDLCFRLEGAAAMDVAGNFAQRWLAVTGETLPLPAADPAASRGGGSAAATDGAASADVLAQCPVQVIRTIPAKTYTWAPTGEFGIAWAYRQAVRNARSFIYLENQYFWSQAMTDELIAALHRVEDPSFRLALVLPARPNIGKRDTDTHVRQLLEADGGRDRVRVFTLYTSGPDERKGWTYKPIYVHAKVAIVDDRWCTVGSANLNGRGFESDSELNAQVIDARVARRLRLRLWAEHLRLPIETIATLSPSQAIDRLWSAFATHGRTVLDARRGALASPVVPYRSGAMPGDLAVGELEAHLLDA